MPIKHASIKSLRQTKKRTLLRTKVAKETTAIVKKMRQLLEAKKKNEAKDLASKVQKFLDKAAKRKVISRNKAGRLKSQLMKKLARL